jgi:hypothetical protein
MTEKPGNLASVMLARDGAISQALRGHADMDELLFAKGAATAAGFRPQYEALQRQPAPVPAAALDVPAAEAPTASRPHTQPFQAAVIAFGSIALLLSAGLYFGARSVDPRPSAPASALASAPPAPAAAAPQLVVQPSTLPAASVPAMPPSEPSAQPTLPEMPAASPSAATANGELVARGTSLLVIGDIAGARLFFERAAEAGDGHAALLAGMTRDPLYLQWAGVHGMQGDPAEAESWYRRARDLGEPDAQRCIDGLAAWRTVSTSAAH